MKSLPKSKPPHWTLGSLEYLECCPFCQADLSENKYSRNDDSTTWSDIWSFYKCPQCSSLYLNPRPDTKSLAKAYQNYYTHTDAKDNIELSDDSLLSSLINGYLNKRFSVNRKNACNIGYWVFFFLFPLRMKLDIYGRNIPKSLCNSNTKLLDIGCGSGDFLIKGKEMGITVYGLENDPVSIKNLKKMGLDIHSGELSTANYSEKYFDYITLNHVIEHVQNPQQTLKEVFHILKEDGTVWLGLPNPNALGIRVFRQGWKGFHPPFHLLIPSQKSLRIMLENAGFTEIKFLHRGIQSKGLWKESINISKQECINISSLWLKIIYFFSNFISCFSFKYSEETIVIAKRPRNN